MTTLEALRRNRDDAFRAYLAVRKAGGQSRAKRRALIQATLEWLECAKAERMIMNNVECITEYHNRYRLHVWHAGDDLYHWRVCHLEGGDYWILGGSMHALPLDCALEVGRRELAGWNEAIPEGVK